MFYRGRIRKCRVRSLELARLRLRPQDDGTSELNFEARRAARAWLLYLDPELQQKTFGAFCLDVRTLTFANQWGFH